MKIKFVKCDYATMLPLPSRGTPHSAGIDLYLASIQECDHGVYKLGYGVKVQIPYGHSGKLYIRSSIGKKGLTFTNKVGLIDCDFRGELMSYATFRHGGYDFPDIGERIAQLEITEYLQGEIVEVSKLDDTVRGEGGFGHTGNK